MFHASDQDGHSYTRRVPRIQHPEISASLLATRTFLLVNLREPLRLHRSEYARQQFPTRGTHRPSQDIEYTGDTKRDAQATMG
jgi:hypothetical protein